MALTHRGIHTIHGGTGETLMIGVMTAYLNRLTDRDFTGHEYLDEFDLINMNGRLYDIILTLLSALIFIFEKCIGSTIPTYLTSRFYHNKRGIVINNIYITY